MKDFLCKKLTIISLVILFLSFLSWIINGKSFLGIDDANIYMIYMRNFANGHGFVYNIGGERVEGFTSLLWTLIGSFCYLITKSPEKLLLAINIVLMTLCLYQLVNFIEKNNIKKNSRKLYLILGLVAFTPGFIDWTIMSLMETGLWCLLLTTTIISILNYTSTSKKKTHYLKFSILCSLLVLCRPESILWCIVFIGLNFLKEYQFKKNIKQSVQYSLWPISLFIIPLLILTIWRLDYFGYPVPNTYYAKVSNNRIDNIEAGVIYLLRAFYQKPLFLAVAITSIYMLVKEIVRKSFLISNVTIVSVFILITFFIPLVSGGDHFRLQRFIIPSVPVMFILLIVIIDSSKFFYSKMGISLILLFTFIYTNHNLATSLLLKQKNPINHEWLIAKGGRESAEKLNVFFKEAHLPSQGILAAGGQAYPYQGKSIDLLGLNNTQMAHAKAEKPKNRPKNHSSFDLNTFFSLAPDIFWYYSEFTKHYNVENKVVISSDRFSSIVCNNIHRDPRFKKKYDYVVIQSPSLDEKLIIFASKDFLAKLPDTYNVNNISYE